MEIFIFKDQLVMRGRVKDLTRHLKEWMKKYPTLQDLIQAHLH